MINDIIERYKAIFKEEGWIVNVIIGGIVFIFSMALIGLPLLLGYFMSFFETLKNKKKCVLPKWQNFEKLFMDGLPVAIFMVVISISVSIIGLIIGLLGCIGAPFSMILNIAYGVISPAIIVIAMFRMIELLNWREAFVLGAFVEDIQKNFKSYLPSLVSIFILSLISFLIGLIGCGLPIPFLLFITTAALYPMLAEIYIKQNALNSNASPVKTDNSENNAPIAEETKPIEKNEISENKEEKDSSEN